MSTPRIAWRATTPCKSCSSTDGTATPCNSSSSTAPSSSPPKKPSPPSSKARWTSRAVALYDPPEADRIAIEVPALVGADVFAAVAEQLQENRRRCRTRRRGACYLLQGLLVCGTCGYAYYGKPLSRSARKGKTRDY